MSELKKETEIETHFEVFKKLAHFTAPSALGVENLPQSILDNLVEHALFLQKKPISLESIAGIIKSQFKLNFEIDEIKLSLGRLTQKNVVVKNNSQFSLEVKHKAELVKIVDEKKECEKKIIQKLVDNIKKQQTDINNSDLNIIKEDFNIFLTNFFLLSGAEAVQLIYGNPGIIEKLINKIQKKNIFDLLPQRDENIRKIEQKEFCEFINLLSEEEKLYLQDLLDRSLQYFTITVDKNCESLLIDDFTNWSLFIDTNFIYNLLGLNHRFSVSRKKTTEKIIELGEKAKINFFVSPVTLEEFSLSVSRAKRLLLDNKISEKLYKIAGSFTENVILSAYSEAQEKYNISPKDFLAKTDNIKDVLESYNIKEKTDYSKSIKGTKEFYEIVKKLKSLTNKEESIAEHDAFHYLLILKLREREGADKTFSTNKSWFITNDSSLGPFDREIRKSEIPFCIRPYQLRQILRPLFSRTDDFESVFIDFVSEPTSRAFPVISTDIAMKILSRITYFEKELKLDDVSNVATKILTNQHFLNKIREFNEEENKQIEFIDQEIKKTAGPEEVKSVSDECKITELKTSKNYWNLFNPFWLIWQLLRTIFNWIRGHTIISILSGLIILLGIIATDYALAWNNIGKICEFIKNLFK